MNKPTILMTTCLLIASYATAGEKVNYPIVDTGLIRCYDDRTEIEFPQKGEKYFGQDGHYQGNVPSYKNNKDGTVSDLITGLMWQRSPGEKMSLPQVLNNVKKCRTGGYKDWRVPTIKELYSLILFSGTDPDPRSRDSSKLKPFIDTEYFTFQYGDERKGERIIDSQYGSSTKYVSTTMRGDATMFGVNFADGRIKGYGLKNPRNRAEDKKFYFIYVRGNKKYGKNDFKKNSDKTITDKATGLTWMAIDSGALNAGKNRDGKLAWQEALAWAEGLKFAGYADWRLPNIKELQSIVDYTRSPKTTKSAAISPLFDISTIKDEGGNKNYPFYWSSSTHKSLYGAEAADYIAFGEALGWMQDRRTGRKTLMDVHGAGSQRSDPKSGNPLGFPFGRGPQGDVIRINNYVICVRGGQATPQTTGSQIEMSASRKPRGQARPSQSATSQSAPSSFIKHLDKNGDGKVSKDEFTGPKRRFSRLDKNSNGFITDDEAPKGFLRRI
ncbi:MAG: DUF1566 domain-containing protein [Victivallaceae bacterium]|nr:DUF1566 domain-containing protein [Victivallaceae bacterium]